MNGFDKIDAQNIAEYIDGKEDSLNLVIERHLKDTYNFICHLIGNSRNAEDITQETFVKVWKNIKKYKPNQSFKTWLFAIARNTAIDWLRKKKETVFSEFETESGNILEDSLIEPALLPDELIAKAEDKKLIEKLLKKIPFNYRTVVLLKYNEQFTFEEIGQVLGKPLNTVKGQYRRALIEIRGLLEGKKKLGYKLNQNPASTRIDNYEGRLREGFQES